MLDENAYENCLSVNVQITYAFVDKTWALFNNLEFIWKWNEIILDIT